MSVLGLQQPNRGATAESHETDPAYVTRRDAEDTREAPVPQTGRQDLDATMQRLRQAFGSRFEVLGPVAIGGMATIFQMRHRLHRGLFAAKVLHAELTQRPGVLRAFRAEATHAARLGDHPNAVPVFDFGDLDGVFFMLMPFVEGVDLDRKLQEEGPLDRNEVCMMAAQMSSLLSHAESAGIVHCDLTPGNLRLDRFGRYRLLDFGISHSGPFTGRPFTGGTPLYASPEQVRGERVDSRTDLYALGIVMAEALSGKLLFAAPTLEAIRQRHIAGDWLMPESLKEGDPLARLLRQLIASDPASRLASAFELSGILDTMGFPRPEFRPEVFAKRTTHAVDAPLEAVQPRRRLSE